MLDGVNRIRSGRGLPSLAPHPELVAAARRHADDMATAGEVVHVGSDGLAASDRIRQAGYRWTATGENVAAGEREPGPVLAAWMRSPAHRAVILDTAAVHAGVGLTAASGDGPRWFWALNLAAPADAESTPALRCHP